MKNRKRLIAVISVILILIIAAAVVIGFQKKNNRKQMEDEGELTVIDEENNDNEETESEESDDNTEDATPSEINGSLDNQSTTNTDENTESNAINVSSFPYEATADGLRFDNVSKYSGYYIEDGSDSDIENVAVMQVTNISDETIEYAMINMMAGDQQLQFKVSLLPAGATAIVMEMNKTPFVDGASYGYVNSTVAYISNLDMCEDEVSVSTDNDGRITVTNISKKDIPELRLFYKNKFDSGEFIGGIAYTAKIDNLTAGSSVTVSPSHFDPDYGTLMMIRTYE